MISHNNKCNYAAFDGSMRTTEAFDSTHCVITQRNCNYLSPFISHLFLWPDDQAFPIQLDRLHFHCDDICKPEPGLSPKALAPTM